MAVYRNTVFHGAVEGLRANYPVVEQIIGHEMFAQVAVDFASDHPPQSPVLTHYGEGLADWLARQSWIAELTYLPDVARVERLHVRCLFAADVAQAAMTGASAPGGSLRLHPGVQFAWLSTPAMSIWLAHQRSLGATIAPEWKPEGALFARRSIVTLHALRIGRAAHRMLAGIRVGETPGVALGAASKLYPDEDCIAVFGSLANLGVFATTISERTN